MDHEPNQDFGDPVNLKIGLRPGTTDGSENSARLQAYCTANPGKPVFFVDQQPTTYCFAQTGAGYQTDSQGRPYRKCVDLGNLPLVRGTPTTTIKLADNQMFSAGSNRGPLSIFCSNSPTDLTVQGLRFHGNTAGQTNWTGQYNADGKKWRQLDGSHAVCASSVGGSYGRVRYLDLHVEDFFANGLIADGYVGHRARNFVGRRLKLRSCGEGLCSDDVDDFDVEDYEFLADPASYTNYLGGTSGKTDGDGIEGARGLRGRWKNIRIRTLGDTLLYAGGGAGDYGGTASMDVEDFHCRYWQAGIGGDISNGMAPLAVRYKNHTYVGISQTAIFLEYPANYELEDIVTNECAHGITATASSGVRPMFVNAKNLQFYAATAGYDAMYLRGDIRFRGENIFARTAASCLAIYKSGSFPGTPFLYGDRWDLYSGAYGVFIRGLSDGAFAPTVTLKGSYAGGGAGASFADQDGATTNVAIAA